MEEILRIKKSNIIQAAKDFPQYKLILEKIFPEVFAPKRYPAGSVFLDSQHYQTLRGSPLDPNKLNISNVIKHMEEYVPFLYILRHVEGIVTDYEFVNLLTGDKLSRYNKDITDVKNIVLHGYVDGAELPINLLYNLIFIR